MDQSHKDRLSKVSTIVGALLINFVGRPFLLWGNICVYIMSFLAIRGHPQSMIPNSWFSLFYNLFWVFGMLVNETLAKCMRVRTVILSGILVFHLFFFGSAAAVLVPWNIYVCVFGAVVGIGIGLYEGLVLKYYVNEWSNCDSSFLFSLFVSSAAVGATVLNYLVTWWVNPNELSPDFKIGGQHVFSGEEIISRVPSMFLILGVIVVALQLGGFSLLRDRTSLSSMEPPKSSLHYYDTFNTSQMEPEVVEEPENETGRRNNSDNSPDGKNNKESNDTLVAFICNRNFHKLWIIQFGLVNLYHTFSHYYKVFGQEWITSEYLLPDFAMTISLSEIVYTVVMGIVIDKLGLRVVMVAISSVSSLLCLAMWFTARIEWLYFLCVLAGTNLSTTQLCLICATKTLFGINNISRNLGVLISAKIVNNLTADLVTKILVANFGWFSVFAYSSFLGLVSLTLISMALPRI